MDQQHKEAVISGIRTSLKEGWRIEPYRVQILLDEYEVLIRSHPMAVVFEEDPYEGEEPVYLD